MTRTGEFLAIAPKKSVSEDELRYPSLDRRGDVMVAAGEHELRTGRAKSLSCAPALGDRKIWDLDGTADVIMTDSRLVYACDKFTKGGAFTLTGKAIRSSVALARRAGKVAVGQIRFEWPHTVTLRTGSLAGIGISYLLVETSTSNGPRTVIFNFGRQNNLDWAEAIVRAVAKFRLATIDSVVSETDRATLNQQALEPTAVQLPSGKTGKETELIFALPGAAAAPF